MNKRQLVNIGNSKDEHYRYKMPVPHCTKKVHRNSFKTSIHNLIDIATSLRVSCTYLTRYLGIELNTNSTEEFGITILHGEYQSDIILNTIQKFIKMFVLCPKCELPEIKLSVDKNENIVYDCACCGSSGFIIDTHKVANYIKINPPKTASEIEIYDDNTFNNDNEVEWEMDFDKTSKKKRKKAMFSDVKEKDNILIDGAISASILKISSGENIDLVIKSESLNPSQLAIILFKLYIDDKDIIGSLKKNNKILCKYISVESQMQFLDCFVKNNNIVEIFWTLYELDIIEEKIFLMWSEYNANTELFKHAEPFITWLKIDE